MTWIGRTALVELDEAERVVREMAGNESTSDQPETVEEVFAALDVARRRGR